MEYAILNTVRDTQCSNGQKIHSKKDFPLDFQLGCAGDRTGPVDELSPHQVDINARLQLELACNSSDHGVS